MYCADVELKSLLINKKYNSKFIQHFYVNNTSEVKITYIAIYISFAEKV